ncbi:hypothetical protein QP167_08325 [Corynebacterium amycolatum]|uniref:hypothetical protein n=1 Tax=Corynebacterium TaxID=1716 RepID=UPI0012472FD5|nr:MULTISPECIES: hypothetical protein [Corynebacterium]KAA9246320.1 hypothetical protein F6I30_03680 [Corynebacterium amycolatum]MBC6793745.1 hypothetical protein [Corynebacterium sp. LK26]MDK6476433.1 hypothetical protein [Corynebacterium amycolatum]MDY7341868.1 hypothetical protein [Corynebacterium amycolatum]
MTIPGIGNMATTTARQQHINFIDTPPVSADTGAAEMTWLAQTWETKIKPPKQWNDLHQRAMQAPKFFHDLARQEQQASRDALVDALVSTNVDQWDKTITAHVEKAATPTYLADGGGVSPLERATTAALRSAARGVANNRATRLQIAAQLDTDTVQRNFQEAARALGQLAWSTDHKALAARGNDYTTFITNGAKLQALQIYFAQRGGTEAQRVPGICLFADITPLEPLQQVNNGIMTGWESTQHDIDEHSSRTKIAAEARSHFPDFLVKLAQGEYDGMKLDISTDEETIKQRIKALDSWGKTEVREDAAARVSLTPGDHQRAAEQRAAFY